MIFGWKNNNYNKPLPKPPVRGQHHRKETNNMTNNSPEFSFDLYPDLDRDLDDIYRRNLDRV